MGYGFLAAIVLVVHLGCLSYLVFGQLLICLGLGLRWVWVRNPWFRWSHLMLICLVGAETLLNLECPFTRWERTLRQMGGLEASSEPFLGRLIHHALAVDSPMWVLNSLPLSLALMGLLTFVVAPPHWRGPRSGVRSQESGVRSQEAGVRDQRSGNRREQVIMCLLTVER